MLGLALLYVTVLTVLVEKGQLRLLLVSLCLMPLAYALPNKLGDLPRTGREMIVVFLIVSLSYFMPLAVDAPIEPWAAVAAGLGCLVTEGFWAVGWYPPTPRDPRSVKQAIKSSIG